MTATHPDGPNSPQAKSQLLARREELRQRLIAIQQDYQRGLSASTEARAQELENAETLAEIARVLNVELAQIEAQLAQT